ncbi:MAG TPA: flavohemoglobin expression-modulating QEGLA motif protein [bacterium]|nr:flavohemoglobin expression-modulating QEGLA motif protein [bacterium]
MKSRHPPLSEAWNQEVAQRLAEGKSVRRRLPPWGRLHMDRSLPFLCLYRRPKSLEFAATERLVIAQASYLTAGDEEVQRRPIARLIETIIAEMTREFGAFLLLEIWNGPPSRRRGHAANRPRFRVYSRDSASISPTAHALARALKEFRLGEQDSDVDLDLGGHETAPGLPPLFNRRKRESLGLQCLGLEVGAIHYNLKTRQIYPLLLRQLQRGLDRAFQKTFFEFMKTRTTQRPANYQALGRRAVVKAVWEVDRQLAEVSNAFDFLLQVTPVNAEQAWRRFSHEGYSKPPVFYYRHLPVDPSLLKRNLYAIPIERIEDPTLAMIFREKQEELERELTMLVDRETPRFVYGSIQLFGGVDAPLIALAQRMLKLFPPRSREESPGLCLGAEAFARRAEAEIRYYRALYPAFKAKAEIRGDIASGLMVSRGNLLISRETRVPVSRVNALLQHEVGTHLVSYYNGRAQPFRQLYSGLAGYEELQEGLAVLSEYLVGGMSRPRLRLLAGRVLATQALLGGAHFVDTYRLLNRQHGFERRTAFTVALRVHRGGGLTKDAVYLRGVSEVIRYLREGGELEQLFIGKIAASHVPVIKELQWRGVLRPPPLLPRYLQYPEARERLKQICQESNVLELMAKRGLL